MIIIKEKQFHLKTKNTSYVMSVYQDKYLLHEYWGESLGEETILSDFQRSQTCGRPSAQHVPLEPYVSLSDLKCEFSVFGNGDFREPTVHIQQENGSTVSEFEYKDFFVYKGKKKLVGLPGSYVESDNEAQTLEIVLEDTLSQIKAILSYSVFYEYDVITRSIRYENYGNQILHLLSAKTMTIDIPGMDYKVLNLNGDWLRECQVEWIPVSHCNISLGSRRGNSSHQHNPFIALAEKNADETKGEVFGISLCYSGNFEMNAEGSSLGSVRLSAGIQSFGFNWELKSNESFQTPEAILAYSSNGLGQLSSIYHKIFRERLCRGKYRDQVRPIVLNIWEALGTDFKETDILPIADVAVESGFEVLVIDDGWFRRGNDTHTNLGDWEVNYNKLPSGLEKIGEELNKRGLKFGLWFEPEMVSPDSNLYREHPDWCLHTEGRERTLMRDELCLDLSRKEICEYIIEKISKILASSNIEYVKWDCNRPITQAANPMQIHQYMLGLYDMMEKLTERFPHILFEGCASGGGRFDPGMLYYMPQIWASDDTYPTRRMLIQYGTSIVYPAITMTAHVGKMDVGYERKNLLMQTSAMVAMTGNMGYEMDLTLLSHTEKEQMKGYVSFYKNIAALVQFGEMYRLENPFEKPYVSIQFVSQDKKESIVFSFQMTRNENGEERRIKLRGLDRYGIYRVNGKEYSGETLMKVGFRIPLKTYEYGSEYFLFEKVSIEICY